MLRAAIRLDHDQRHQLVVVVPRTVRRRGRFVFIHHGPAALRQIKQITRTFRIERQAQRECFPRTLVAVARVVAHTTDALDAGECTQRVHHSLRRRCELALGLREHRIREVDVWIVAALDPLAGTEHRGRCLVRSPTDLFVRHPATVDPLGQRARAVIARDHHRPVAGTELLVEQLEKLAELNVEAQLVVPHLPRFVAPAVADVVVRREADHEEVGDPILAEVFAGDRGTRRIEHELVTDRGRVKRFGRLLRRRGIVRESRSETFLAELAVLIVGRAGEPREQRRIERRPHLARAWRDRIRGVIIGQPRGLGRQEGLPARGLDVVPDRRAGMTKHQDRRAIFEADRDRLRAGLRGGDRIAEPVHAQPLRRRRSICGLGRVELQAEIAMPPLVRKDA